MGCCFTVRCFFYFSLLQLCYYCEVEVTIPLGDAEVCRGERESARRCLSEQGERVYVEPRSAQTPRVSALANEITLSFDVAFIGEQLPFDAAEHRKPNGH